MTLHNLVYLLGIVATSISYLSYVRTCVFPQNAHFFISFFLLRFGSVRVESSRVPEAEGIKGKGKGGFLSFCALPPSLPPRLLYMIHTSDWEGEGE